MGKELDWLTNLENLKSILRYGYDADLEIYSGIVFSRTRSEDELRDMFSLLEPAFDGDKLVHSISIPLANGSILIYVYFGRNERGLEVLNDGLSEVESLLKTAPPGLLPQLALPDQLNAGDRNLVIWTSMVYSTAWAYDQVYLRAVCEYQRTISDFEFSFWPKSPGKLSFNPRKWLTLRIGFEGELRRAETELKAANVGWPDVIDAYLIDDLFSSSTAAIDLLKNGTSTSNTAAMRHPKRGRPAKSVKSRQKQLRTRKNLAFLKEYLYTHHFRDGVQEPLKQVKIAEAMKISQETVSRLIREIVPGGMDAYRRAFKQDDTRRELVTKLKEGRLEVDRIHDEEDVDSVENSDE